MMRSSNRSLNMRSANPALNTHAFQGMPRVHGNVMTLSGTVNKTGILTLILVAAASVPWRMAFSGDRGAAALMPVFSLGGAIVGLILALIITRKKTLAPVLAPAYAVAEGLFVGAFSAIFEAMYPGIVIQAVSLTFGTLFALLAAYKSGLIKPTENFKLGVAAATGAIFLFYMASLVLSFFGISMPLIHSSGPLGIGFSLFVIAIASANLVMDFDFIEEACEGGRPKYMEWYGAFGLMVTLIWLYIEFVRLLAKLQSRR